MANCLKLLTISQPWLLYGYKLPQTLTISQPTLTVLWVTASNSNTQSIQADSAYTEEKSVFNWFIDKHDYIRAGTYDRPGYKTEIRI